MPRILIVEDAALVRLYYRQALTGAGFAVEEALNGVEALERLAASGPFDLLILDINMPKMDGLTCLHTLRSDPGPVASVPVLMTSSEAGAEDVEAARLAGANYYLVKPVSPEELCRCAAVLAGWRP
jgi:two-component system chemotaxis response regulator CheY